MKRLIEQKYIARQNMIAFIGVCLCFYFGYHLLAGERSYLRLASLNYQIDKTSVALEQTKADRAALEEKVVMMRPGSVNRDLLEEQAQKILGYRYKDEKVIIKAN
jgi:cell division protein FtsB